MTEVEKLRASLARLERTHAGDHRGFIASRRVLLGHIGKLEAEISRLKAEAP